MRSTESKAERRQKKITMKKWLENASRQFVWWFIINSTIWIYATYLLAFLGREEIAESLSQVIVTEIIKTLMLIVVSKTVENIFTQCNSGKTKKSAGEQKGEKTE